MAKKPEFDWTEDIEEEILERLASGESILDICKDAQPALPTRNEVAKHERANPLFRSQMGIATKQFARVKFEEAINLADNTTSDWRRRVTKGGEEVEEANNATVARSRLMIETRLKVAGKLDPGLFGDKSKVEVTGKDGGPIETKDVSPLDLARRMALLLERGKRAKLADTNATSAAPVQKVALHPVVANFVQKQNSPEPDQDMTGNEDVL